jgi:hypothetical protein
MDGKLIALVVPEHKKRAPGGEFYRALEEDLADARPCRTMLLGHVERARGTAHDKKKLIAAIVAPCCYTARQGAAQEA